MHGASMHTHSSDSGIQDCTSQGQGLRPKGYRQNLPSSAFPTSLPEIIMLQHKQTTPKKELSMGKRKLSGSPYLRFFVLVLGRESGNIVYRDFIGPY